jgi:hypothetical protein
MNFSLAIVSRKRNRIPSQPARLIFVMVALIWAAPARAQDLGHKVLGTLGLLAGSQPSSGVYVVNRFLSYRANEVIDRDGRRIPVGSIWTLSQTGLGSRSLSNCHGFRPT